MSTLVSVLITSFNHGQYLGMAIESVLRQDLDDFTLFILDDSSADNSPDIARQYERQDARIKFIACSQNAGKAHLLNEQLPRCNSKYIALLDSDDYWLPGKLRKQVSLLESSPETGVVYADGIVVDNRSPATRESANSAWSADVNGKLFGQIHRAPARREGWVFQELLCGNFLFYSSAVIRRSCLSSIRFREELRRSIDWYFFIDLAQVCPFAYIDEPLAAYRVHGQHLQELVAGTDEMAQPRRFVLETYGQFMPRRVRAQHLGHLGNEHERLGNHRLSLTYLAQSLLLNPFDAHTWGYAIRAITHGHKATEHALRRVHSTLSR